MKRIRELGQYLSEQRVPLYAANASFFLILSIFPMLVVLLALMRYTGLQVETFTDPRYPDAHSQPAGTQCLCQFHRYNGFHFRDCGPLVGKPGDVQLRHRPERRL